MKEKRMERMEKCVNGMDLLWKQECDDYGGECNVEGLGSTPNCRLCQLPLLLHPNCHLA
jgi:hypothetical protein